jgi:hypothetical protein
VVDPPRARPGRQDCEDESLEEDQRVEQADRQSDRDHTHRETRENEAEVFHALGMADEATYEMPSFFAYAHFTRGPIDVAIGLSLSLS